MNPTKTSAWQSLLADKIRLQNTKIIELFQKDTYRFDRFSVRYNSIMLDYSKSLIDEETITHLIELANQVNLKQKIEDMFAGKHINFTENRAVLHTALRYQGKEPIIIEGENISQRINTVKLQMKTFSESLHNGNWRGYTGKKISDVVNIGIGGSDLGPAMVCKALSHYAKAKINVHFVSNVDANDFVEIVKKLNPEKTLFIIASKTFTTLETMTNATSAKDWFLSKSDADDTDLAKHFVAISTNKAGCLEFGIPEENMFEFWDWVGGRYSLWSAIGLSIAIYVGYENFEKLLQGAYYLDQHFHQTPFDKNIPVILALLGVWYKNFMNYTNYAVIPYDQYLSKFTEFLQQLDMESNGKYINSMGEEVDYRTGISVWGTAGTNAQHSFFQLIHQGTQTIPIDFLVAATPINNISDHHQKLIANCFAQAEALMKGKTKNEVIEELKKQNLEEKEINKIYPHKVFKGNIPSNTIIYKKLTPEVLGSLIAIYEHKVFVEGIIWDINSFDQWGVELGKQLAGKIIRELNNSTNVHTHDASTNGLINYYININKKQID
ncbi:MAG TPA: glucose-6-phosphate isomerase [Candidatus Kapabacteria bacterium]|nr:glucose-6-phosphate isomerase [Candidatus Kapabacteria bacterium]